MAKGITKFISVIGLIAILATVFLSLFSGFSASAEVITDVDAPSQVEGLEALPGDGLVTLTWDASTDDTGVDGYYVYSSLKSVETNGGAYTFGSTNAGNSATYTMEGLTNGVTYYFAVTAYDEAGNESNYSSEADATPDSSTTGDFVAPTVSDANAVSSTLVEVSFSEAVLLPESSALAFSLEATDGTAVAVLDAYSSTEEPATVFLVTDAQIAGAQYILTTGIGVTDLAGNPVESGTSDTAIFTGSALEKSEPDAVNPSLEDSAFAIEEVTSVEINELLLDFNQKIVSVSPTSFTIQKTDDASALVEVLAVSVDSTDATLVTLITKDMDAGYDYVLTIDETVLNEAGSSLPINARTVDFTAKTIDLADVIAPEDITNLVSALSGETAVMLTWDASANTAGDLAKYLVYQSADGGSTFGDSVAVAMDVLSYEASDLTPGSTYTFKVTAVDENGNESDGVMTTITLPESGPELLLLGLMALAGAGVVGKRRK
ncbi:MAG: fibronectin type III domain-containing protein [Candidatus Gracilibacteria bacterium]